METEAEFEEAAVVAKEATAVAVTAKKAYEYDKWIAEAQQAAILKIIEVIYAADPSTRSRLLKVIGDTGSGYEEKIRTHREEKQQAMIDWIDTPYAERKLNKRFTTPYEMDMARIIWLKSFGVITDNAALEVVCDKLYPCSPCPAAANKTKPAAVTAARPITTRRQPPPLPPRRQPPPLPLHRLSRTMSGGYKRTKRINRTKRIKRTKRTKRIYKKHKSNKKKKRRTRRH